MNSLRPSVQVESSALVSVVIPTKSRPDTVRRAVRSALDQTIWQIEVIVVVDGFDPETMTALKAFEDSRIYIVELPTSVGGAEARNIGVRSAHADWIAFLDDDDEWLPQKLEIQLASARAVLALLPVVCSAYIARSSTGDARFGRRAPRLGEPTSEYMFCRKGPSYGENALATSVLFVPRRLMLLVPFNPELKRHQDWDWALRALSLPETALCYIEEPLSIYYMADEGAQVSSHKDWQYSLDWCRAQKALFTPKAFSFFIATECFTRARQANAGTSDLVALVGAYWREGQPTVRSALIGLVLLLTSKRLRRLLLGLSRNPKP